MSEFQIFRNVCMSVGVLEKHVPVVVYPLSLRANHEEITRINSVLKYALFDVFSL